VEIVSWNLHQYLKPKTFRRLEMQHLRDLFSIVLVSLIMLVLASCHIAIKGQNDTAIDGTKLKYDNEITLSDNYDLSDLEILGGTLSISLKGHADSDMTLAIKYREYEPGDAVAYISNGKIRTKSKSGKPVSIYNVTGYIPENLGLDIKTGTGTIELSGLKGQQNISIISGTGDIELTDSSIKVFSAKAGTGSVTLSNNQVNTASIKIGTGDIILNNSKINQQEFSTGTGKIIQKEPNPVHKNKGSI